MNVYLKELKHNRKSLIVWSICAAVLLGMSYLKFVSMYAGNVDINALMSQLPRMFAVLMGIGGSVDFSTAKGFYALLTAYSVYLMIFNAGLLGVRVIAREEDLKTTEFLYTKPISRSKVLFQKLLAALTCCIILNLVILLVSLATFPAADASLSADIIIFSMFALLLQVIYLGLGAVCAVLSSNSSKAGGLIILILIGTLSLSKALDMMGSNSFLWIFTPVNYFVPQQYMYGQNINPLAYVLAALLISLTGYIMFTRYEKKDILV
ncbi:MAG: ABC-2 family transporter protein [Pelotomaculum sp. PtaB.Bin104]|nr:MAG: ABC-2 family transporter protein [Pelotomaculum sp. PtaB.Bin104]